MTKEMLSKVKLKGTNEGSGLGLTITGNLVDVLQGAISVESEADKGTVVMVDIPFKSTTGVVKPTEKQFSDISASISAGMNAHISKPIDIRNLYSCIESMLRE